MNEIIVGAVVVGIVGAAVTGVVFLLKAGGKGQITDIAGGKIADQVKLCDKQFDIKLTDITVKLQRLLEYKDEHDGLFKAHDKQLTILDTLMSERDKKHNKMEEEIEKMTSSINSMQSRISSMETIMTGLPSLIATMFEKTLDDKLTKFAKSLNREV